jgi:hypothetical protein
VLVDEAARLELLECEVLCALDLAKAGLWVVSIKLHPKRDDDGDIDLNEIDTIAIYTDTPTRLTSAPQVQSKPWAMSHSVDG